MGTLGAPALKGLGDIGCIYAIEVPIGVFIRIEEGWGILTSEPAPEPAPLHFGHVPDEAQKGQGGWRNCPLAELRFAQAFALERECRSVVLEPRVEHRSFISDVRGIGTIISHCAIIADERCPRAL